MKLSKSRSSDLPSQPWGESAVNKAAAQLPQSAADTLCPASFLHHLGDNVPKT